MKIETEKGIFIELTEDQLKSIEKQKNKSKLPTCINDLRGNIEHYFDITNVLNSSPIMDKQTTLIGTPNEKLAKAQSALNELLFYRQAYWDSYQKGWEPNWDMDYNKYCILVLDNKLNTSMNHNASRILSFPTKELRDLFLNNFKHLIEIAKPLL